MDLLAGELNDDGPAAEPPGSRIVPDTKHGTGMTPGGGACP